MKSGPFATDMSCNLSSTAAPLLFDAGSIRFCKACNARRCGLRQGEGRDSPAAAEWTSPHPLFD
jgi:hypothetical protein